MANLIRQKIQTSTPFAGSGANVSGLDYLPNVLTIGRNPTAADGGVLGQIVQNNVNNTLWILSRLASPLIAGNQWTQFIVNGGVGTFTQINATIGPNDLAGITTIGAGLIVTAGGIDVNAGGANIIGGLDVTAGPIDLNDAGADDVDILTGASTGDFNLNNDNGTGDIQIGNPASGQLTLSSGNAIAIGDVLNLPLINIGNAAPTVNRRTTISGGLLGAAVNNILDLGSGGVNFAGSLAQVSLGGGPVTIGTNNIFIGDGNVAAAGIQAIEIGNGNVANGGQNVVGILNGTIAAGGVAQLLIGGGTGQKTIQIGNGDMLTTTGILGKSFYTTPATTLVQSGINIACGAGAYIQIMSGAGAPINMVTLGATGSLYMDTNGGAMNARLYFASAPNTWVAISTLA